ncbi:hypothetical protein [Maridesulfovibrio hydrothermalis]|uniref:Uncharacterized protein n=1 Tax=Maridesulfovibrio hydrothermalis AM13 = DSM 14728 TaxID=1121451 RepID=L0RAV4_9BACT|nr:hypothetical protein [Maridesulfovibrio hydrothermalis]CCO22706.1 exported protein of unknown function [Maridesulfovibrio hydrothermalis AM13 = DSM 14728]
MKKLALTIMILAFLAACNSAPHDKLNGTWQNEVMSMTIDFDKGTYNGVAMGKQFSRDLKLVSEDENAVVFTVGGKELVAQFQPEGGILINMGGKLPLSFVRVE